MKNELKRKFDAMYKRPFPILGKSVGDFVLFDGSLMGTVDSILGGIIVPRNSIPECDDETDAFVNELNKKAELTADEKEFLSYYGGLMELRGLIERLSVEQ